MRFFEGRTDQERPLEAAFNARVKPLLLVREDARHLRPLAQANSESSRKSFVNRWQKRDRAKVFGSERSPFMKIRMLVPDIRDGGTRPRLRQPLRICVKACFRVKQVAVL